MSSRISDTHAAIWYAVNPTRLSAPAAGAFQAATDAGMPIYLPSISLVEMRFLVDKRKIPESVFGAIASLLNDPSSPFRTAALTEEIALAVRRISRDEVPNMQDRIIAATALHLGLPLVTCDGKIRAAAVRTIW